MSMNAIPLSLDILCRTLSLGLMLACLSRANAQESALETVVSQPVATTGGWYSPDFWNTIDGRPVEESWRFGEGTIELIQPRGGKGSLLSPPMPEHFDLSFEWMIQPRANNGLKYRVRAFDDRWLGIEYQMIDEPIPLVAAHEGSTASIYDLVAPSLDKPLNPPAQWNHARIVAQGHRLQHYLNGQLVASANMHGPQWEAIVAQSKFYGLPDFGLPRPGDRIMLTDHGGLAAYRNFQFTALDSPTVDAATTVSTPQLGNGMRNSWADQHSIVLWTRTTARAEMVKDGPEFLAISREQERQWERSLNEDQLLAVQLPEGTRLDQMQGACPGAPGEVRLIYFPEKKRTLSRSTDWTVTQAQTDYTCQWKLEELQPGTSYVAIVEARPIGQTEISAVLRGRFQTAAEHDLPVPQTFCMTTCHDYIRRDDDLGHRIYPAMQQLSPDWMIHAGDVEYYDKPNPWAWTIDLMRFKWARLFSLPRLRDFYANHTSYFIKDDHDTLKNDCWPGQTYGAVSFEQGVHLFNQEQFPARTPRYTTVQWGRDLQFWVLEGRDFRSPNTMQDGPDKTILGKEQKAWLLESVRASTATFKLVFSPTPVVGPDRERKSDNHANETFEHEGLQLRDALSAVDGLIIFCGDRHWQYASVDPQTGLWEFGCGPGSERHELGWQEGDVRPEHRFLRVQGGFLSGQLTYDPNDGYPSLLIRHHTVDGEEVSRFEFNSSLELK
jgi:hypothetical protein